jgi:hypothetical protein
MGLITEAPLALLRKQMELHGTVVWDDPERAHVKLTAGLTAEKVPFKPLGVFSLSAVGCLLAAATAPRAFGGVTAEGLAICWAMATC